jgi:hypothetical protein
MCGSCFLYPPITINDYKIRLILMSLLLQVLVISGLLFGPLLLYRCVANKAVLIPLHVWFDM